MPITLEEMAVRPKAKLNLAEMAAKPAKSQSLDEMAKAPKAGYSLTKDVVSAVKEIPQDLKIGTIGMAASTLEAIKRRAMQLSGGGILPDKAVRSQFEAVKATKPITDPTERQIDELFNPRRDFVPAANVAEAFGLATRMPDIGAKLLRDKQQKLTEAQDRVTLKTAPITRLSRSVMQSGVPSMAVAVGISVLTGDPLIGMAILGETEGGAAFEKQLQEGSSIRKANILGDLSEAAEIGGEMLVFPKFVKGLTNGIPLKQALTLIAENATQEGITGFNQQFLETFGIETTKGTGTAQAIKKAFSDGVAAIPENAFVGGATAGLVDITAAGTSRLLGEPKAEQLPSINQAAKLTLEKPKADVTGQATLEGTGQTMSVKPPQAKQPYYTPGEKRPVDILREVQRRQAVEREEIQARHVQEMEAELTAIQKPTPEEKAETALEQPPAATDIEAVKRWERYNEILDKGQDLYNTKNPVWEKSRDKIILDNVIAGNKKVGYPDSDLFSDIFKQEAKDAGLVIYDKGKWSKYPLVAKNASDIKKYLEAKDGMPDEYELLGITQTPAATDIEGQEKLHIAALQNQIKEIEEMPATEISRQKRSKLARQTADEIKGHDLYKDYVSALEEKEREIGPGFYYVPKKFRSEVEDIIGVKKGFPTKLQRMFTFDPADLNRATDWEKAVQSGLSKESEGQYDTSAEMDISDFVSRVKEAVENQEKYGGLNKNALDALETASDPYLQYKINKFNMLRAGETAESVDEMTIGFADRYEIGDDEIAGELISPQGRKILELRNMADETIQDAEIEKLAEENVRERLRQEGAEAVNKILEDNGIEIDVRQVQEIEEYTLPEKPDDDIPFERAGKKPIGAYINRTGREIIQVAYGADIETGYHEAFHALKGRLSENSRAILDKHYKADNEAQARAFARYARDGSAPTNTIRHIFKIIRQTLERIKNALRGLGYKSAEDVFRGIVEGTIEKVQSKTGQGPQYEFSNEQARREVIKRAAINAEKARLKSKIKPKKVSKAKIKVKIWDVTPGLREDFKVEIPLPPAKKIEKKPQTVPLLSSKWMEMNAQEATLKEKFEDIKEAIGDKITETGRGIDKIIASSTSRLYKISPVLFRAVRRYAFDSKSRAYEQIKEMLPFLKAAKKIKGTDRIKLDLALKNRVDWQVYEILHKYKITDEFEQCRAIFNEIYRAANEVGMDIRYLEQYWPRVLKDPKGFLRYFQQRDDWSIIEQAIKKRAEAAGRKIEDLTEEEMAATINTLLRGFRTGGVTLSKPGAAKERTVEIIDKTINKFYADFTTSAVRYVEIMNEKIAAREFFGKETQEIQRIRTKQSIRRARLSKLGRREGLRKATEKDYTESIKKVWDDYQADEERLKRLQSKSPIDTIGGYVMRLQSQGKITPVQEKEIQGILEGIFAPQKMGRNMSIFSASIYLDTLNSAMQALTQLDEFAYSFHMSPARSIPAAIRTLIGKSKLAGAEVGIKGIGEEVRTDENLLQRALGIQLNLIGLQPIDYMNKQTLINTALSKYTAQAKRKNLNAGFINTLQRAFGRDYKDVIDDLKNGKITDDVKFLIFNEIADRQPIAGTEMPEAYNKGGNLRILYALKSFYLKRFDYIRNECFAEMKSAKTFHRGLSKLVWLAFSFALMGVGTDFLKAFIRGQKFDLSDSLLDNLLRMAFFSKYQAWKTKDEGIGSAFLGGIRPPTKSIDAATKDIINTAKGKDRGFELWRSVPYVGELYYWWFGEGKAKKERKQQKQQGKGSI